ncbi:hypothetical protein ACUXV3_09995 [Roseobacteraceae bacterium NS-SX3]
MKKTMFTTLLGLTAAFLTAQPAIAQNRSCAPRDVVVQRLAEHYGETRQSIGLGERGMVMETFASAETGTWTITVTTPTGLTCLMASGQSFEPLAETLPVKKTDA